MAVAQLMQQLSLLKTLKCVHIAGADGPNLHPAMCPAHFLACLYAMPDHNPALTGKGWLW